MLHGDSVLRSHRPEQRTLWPQFPKCIQIYGKQRAFSGHARDRPNPDDLAKLGKDISMSYLTQVEPSLESNCLTVQTNGASGLNCHRS